MATKAALLGMAAVTFEFNIHCRQDLFRLARRTAESGMASAAVVAGNGAVMAFHAVLFCHHCRRAALCSSAMAGARVAVGAIYILYKLLVADADVFDGRGLSADLAVALKAGAVCHTQQAGRTESPGIG